MELGGGVLCKEELLTPKLHCIILTHKYQYYVQKGEGLNQYH